MRRVLTATIRILAVTTMLLALGATSVAAHTQTVDPNGNGEGFTKPISNPWAMAHCQAASPLIIAERSNGVVQFEPPNEFENCVPGTRRQDD